MNFEINRIYCTIIDDVIKALEEDIVHTEMDTSVISELKSAWWSKLSSYTDLGSLSRYASLKGDVCQLDRSMSRAGGVASNMYIVDEPLSAGTHCQDNGGRVNSEDPVDAVSKAITENGKSTDDESSDGDNSNDGDNDECKNYMMCLYVKVTRTKGRWKCNFKDGFINIGPMDFAFNSAQGDLFW